MAAFAVTGDQYRDIDRKMMELKRQLNQKGGCPQDPEFIKRGLQSLIEGNFEATKPVKVKIKYVHRLFVPTDRQIANIRRWNTRYGWGFTEEQIAEAEKSVPMWPENKPARPAGGLVAVVLVPYLDEMRTTFDALWSIVAKRQDNHWRYEGFDSDGYLRLLSGIKHPGKCLRWEVIDLAANWNKQSGTAPKDVRNEKFPHAGILAAAAHHPRWVRVMDGENVPYVWASGYECGGEQNGWRCVPWLYFNQRSRKVRLYGYGSADRYCNRAVPVLLGE